MPSAAQRATNQAQSSSGKAFGGWSAGSTLPRAGSSVGWSARLGMERRRMREEPPEARSQKPEARSRRAEWLPLSARSRFALGHASIADPDRCTQPAPRLRPVLVLGADLAGLWPARARRGPAPRGRLLAA